MARNLPPRMYKQYRVYYWAGRVDGKKKWVRLSDDYQEALHKYAEIEVNPKNTGMVSDTIDRYKREILPRMAEKTRNTQGYQLDKLAAVFGNMHLSKIEPPHINQYLDQRDAKVSANREIKLLSSIYRYAIGWGLCRSNPCIGAFYHPEKERDRYISDDEFILLQEKAEPMLRAIIQIAYLTGMRRGDILDLKLSDIDEQKGIYNRQGKTGKRQLFKMTPALLSAIRISKTARKTRNLTYLFTNNKAQKITETGFNSAWRRLRERTKLTDITFHDLRAKAITDAKEKGGLDYAQALGGHENRDMTERYIKSKSTDKIDPIQ